MKKFTNILEQRIYLFYFLLTFIMVLIIISVEWQLVKYGIRMTENQKINYLFENYKNKVNEIYNQTEINLKVISDYLKTKKDLKKENIITILNIVGSGEYNKNIHIFNDKGKIIYGEYWDLIKKYFDKLFLITKKKKEGYIIAGYGNKNYIMIYKSLWDKDSNYLGFILQINKFKLDIPFLTESKCEILPYPILKVMLKKNIVSYFQTIQKVCKNDFEKEKQVNKILRLSYSWIVGLYPNYDGAGFITSVFIVYYQRDINIFAQQSIWLFILILIAVTLIMITIFGNWFKKAILHPVNVLSETMKKNSEYPVKLRKINLNYGGVLGEMIESFNQMEESLEKYSQSLLEYKIATENIENGVFWLDEDFKVIMFNNSFLRILEVDKQIVGKSLLDYITLTEKEILQLKSGSLSLKNFEYKVSEGKIKHLNINFRTVKEKNRKIIVGGITDITQITLEKIAREKLELELIKTNKLAEIGRRVEGIVHNMNSPLNSIIGYAQLMKKEIGENEDLEKILNSGKLMAHYIKSLQQKIKNDNSSVYHPLDINKLLKDELELFKNNLFYKHYVKTIMDFDENLPKLNAVYGDVSMCITNIINNALEAMEQSSKKILRITTQKVGNSIKIIIADTGCGIEKKDLENIFEPYYTTKTYPKGSGYGLGLAISKYIMEKYKGKILVQSEVGKGSVFTLVFPLKK